MREADCETLADAFVCYEGLVRSATLQGRCGFTKSQCAALWTLAVMGDMSMGSLAKHLAVSKEQATRMVNPLVEQGLIERERSEANRRIVNASLTSTGHDEICRQIQERNQQIEQVLEVLDEDELQRLIEAARTSSEIIKKAFGILGPVAPDDAVQ